MAESGFHSEIAPSHPGIVSGATKVLERNKSDHEWWRASEPLLEEVFDPDRFPTASRIGPAAAEASGSAYDPEYSFEFGLQRLLDGIETLVRSRSELPDR